jgi:hypothetical protein
MFIHFGQSLFGKVDQVPGLFHVATKFFHLDFFPLIPTGSYLVVEQSHTPREIALPWKAKSILCAWLRLALMAGAACLSFFGAGMLIFVMLELADGRQVDRREMVPAVASAVSAIVLWSLLYGSYVFTRAKPLRALELARLAGISPEELAHYFVDHPDLAALRELAVGADDSEIETRSSFPYAGQDS